MSDLEVLASVASVQFRGRLCRNYDTSCVCDTLESNAWPTFSHVPTTHIASHHHATGMGQNLQLLFDQHGPSTQCLPLPHLPLLPPSLHGEPLIWHGAGAWQTAAVRQAGSCWRPFSSAADGVFGRSSPCPSPSPLCGGACGVCPSSCECRLRRQRPCALAHQPICPRCVSGVVACGRASSHLSGLRPPLGGAGALLGHRAYRGTGKHRRVHGWRDKGKLTTMRKGKQTEEFVHSSNLVFIQHIGTGFQQNENTIDFSGCCSGVQWRSPEHLHMDGHANVTPHRSHGTPRVHGSPRTMSRWRSL